LEEFIEKEEMEQPAKPLLPLYVFLQETVAFILGTCTRVNEKNATFSSISRCLGVSSRTRRVVNLDFRRYNLLYSISMNKPSKPEPAAFRYRITVAYDGSAYAGWQVQPHHMTVQQRIEEVLQSLAGETVKVHGSGRTDQGVHAEGQVAHFDLSKKWECWQLMNGLNAKLPQDIRVLKVARTKPDFHARRSAVKKEYRYFIWNAKVMNPNRRRVATHIRKPLDVAAMQAAATILVGKHDFAAFTANPNRIVESTVREVYSLSVKRTGALIVIRASSEGFLYKMVRSLTGLLLRVGEGAVPLEEVKEILASKIRTARVPTAPPEGLFLWRVWY
jgi:tRNA pseudouridine38-40 synthase